MLPNNDKTSLWSLDTSQNRWITIQTSDDNYCSECTYLIGIESQFDSSKYQITIEQPSDTGFIEKTLIFGVTLEDEVYDKKVKWYSVVIDGQKDFNIYNGVSGGQIQVDLFYDQESKDKPISSSKGGETIKVRNLPNKIQNIYVRVTGLQYSFFSLLLAEPNNVIMLTEGTPIMSEVPN